MRAEGDEDGQNNLNMASQTSVNYSLCNLLNIDVDELALQIVIKDQTNR